MPAPYRHDQEGYVDLVINEMLPQVAAANLADFIDVFCDRGFFTAEEIDVFRHLFYSKLNLSNI